ncbi:MAG: hypothetical protein U0K86_07680 [Agathobacter sp.]|nr:hypothetical protein [Agathobacter sp.]
MKRIFAILGVILLVALYVITFIMAITDNTSTMRMFEAAVIATIIIPTLMWIYAFIYRLLNKNNDSKNDKLTK